MRVLWYALFIILLSSQAAPAVTGNSKTRTISFPSSGLGKYYIDNGQRPFLAQWPEFAERRWAKGRVTVPASASVAVETYWCANDCMPNLSRLKPADIQCLDVDGSALTQATFKYICKLTGLKRLILEGTDAGDREVEIVALKMPMLQELNLGYSRVSDRSLRSIATMSSLKSLSLQKDGVTAAGISRLAEMPSITDLNLKETKIGNEALAAFSKSKTLSAINLAKTKVTDAGLTSLLSMRNLRKLDLSETAITDVGVINALAKLENLEELNLSGTKVTDRGVMALNKLSHLRKLWLRDLYSVSDASTSSLILHSELEDLELQKTNISQNAIQRLAGALPKSEVHSKALCKCRKQTRVN